MILFFMFILSYFLNITSSGFLSGISCSIIIIIIIIIIIHSSRGWPESYLFISYYIEVLERALLLIWMLHFTLDPCLIMLSGK